MPFPHVNFCSDWTWFLLELISVSSCRLVRLQRLVSRSLARRSLAASASKRASPWPQAAREDASEMLANFDEIERSLRGFNCSHKMLLHPFPKAHRSAELAARKPGRLCCSRKMRLRLLGSHSGHGEGGRGVPLNGPSPLFGALVDLSEIESTPAQYREAPSVALPPVRRSLSERPFESFFSAKAKAAPRSSAQRETSHRLCPPRIVSAADCVRRRLCSPPIVPPRSSP